MTTKIPPEIENLMYSEEVERELVRIGQEENLHVDQLGDLHDSVNMVFLGELHSTEFVSDIKKMLDLSEEKARSVASKVNERIFVPAREVLKAHHEEKPHEIDMLNQNFEAKSVLNAISNPTSIPTTSTVTQSTPVIETPKPAAKIPTAPLPDMLETPLPNAEDIHMQKFANVTISGSRSTEQNISSKKPLIPKDHLERINSDPYKENPV